MHDSPFCSPELADQSAMSCLSPLPDDHSNSNNQTKLGPFLLQLPMSTTVSTLTLPPLSLLFGFSCRLALAPPPPPPPTIQTLLFGAAQAVRRSARRQDHIGSEPDPSGSPVRPSTRSLQLRVLALATQPSRVYTVPGLIFTRSPQFNSDWNR